MTATTLKSRQPVRSVCSISLDPKYRMLTRRKLPLRLSSQTVAGRRGVAGESNKSANACSSIDLSPTVSPDTICVSDSCSTDACQLGIPSHSNATTGLNVSAPFAKRVSLSPLKTRSEVHQDNNEIDECFRSISDGTFVKVKFAPPTNCGSDSEDEGVDDSSIDGLNISYFSGESNTSSSSDDSSDLSSPSSSSPRSVPRVYRIRFSKVACVREIPNRFSYSKKQRKRMWNGNKDIRNNAKRNKVEFEWENWEWQNAVEEDEFLLVNGQPIHPAHIP